MRVRLLDFGEDQGGSCVETDSDDLPPIDAIFTVDGYPFRCKAHVPETERDPFPGVVVAEAPAEMLVSLLPPGTEDLAKTNYELSCSIAQSSLPNWEQTTVLTRWGFRRDAESLGETTLARGTQ